MKVQIFSQWTEEVYIPVRVKQFTKAAKLAGEANFIQYYHRMQDTDVSLDAASKDAERQAVAAWVDTRAQVRESLQQEVA